MSKSLKSDTATGRLLNAAMRGRFAVLFWLLVVAIAVPVALPDGPFIRRGMSVILFVVMLSGLNAIANNRRELVFGVVLAVPDVAFNELGLGLGNFQLYAVSQFLYLGFFIYLAGLILRWTMRKLEVDTDTIYGAVSVYLLMALIWGLAFHTIAITSPGSFHLPDEDELGRVQEARAAPEYEIARPVSPDWRRISDSAQGTMMYYSFVTLTTLGYGDIYPTSDATRILAMLEATLGQLFLVILVARLVGLYTAQEAERRRGRDPPGSASG